MQKWQKGLKAKILARAIREKILEGAKVVLIFFILLILAAYAAGKL